jgi:hypothetical protein
VADKVSKLPQRLTALCTERHCRCHGTGCSTGQCYHLLSQQGAYLHDVHRWDTYRRGFAVVQLLQDRIYVSDVTSE